MTRVKKTKATELTGNEGTRVLKGNRLVRAVPHKPADREVQLDAEGNTYTKKHPSSGQRGRLIRLNFRDGSSETYLRKAVAKDAQRGSQRRGVQAKDLAVEAVYTNETSSPRIEVPRVLVETLQMDVTKLTAADIALWWRLFAEARLEGLATETHYIQLSALARYLGIRSLDRVKASLRRLSAAKLSHHSRTGRRTENMLRCPDAEDLSAMSGSDWMHYSLPPGLRALVLNSTGFCRIDLNVLTRFKSKFSSPMYIRLCYEAGKARDFHDEVHLTKADFGKIVGLKATQAEVIHDAIERVREDLMTIDGPRRRFHIDTFVNVSDKLVLTFGSAKMRLVETKPAYMTDEGLKVLADRTMFNLSKHQYPSIVRLRQAETLLKVHATSISELWRLDVQRASSKYPEGCIGYTAKEFRSRIRKLDADAVFAEWIEKREFPEAWRVVREELPPLQKFVREKRAPKRIKKAVATVVPVKAALAVIVDGDDIRLGDDYADLEYGDLDMEPPAMFEADDSNDDDIAF